MKAILDISPSSTVLLGLALLTFIIYSFYKSSALRAILPPGPRGYPLVGNLFDISPRLWESFTEWKKQYGQSNAHIFCQLDADLYVSRPHYLR